MAKVVSKFWHALGSCNNIGFGREDLTISKLVRAAENSALLVSSGQYITAKILSS